MSISPLTDREKASESIIEEIPGMDPPVPPERAANSEFVFGPRQLASLAFVGILLIGIMSAIAYFAGRKNTSPQQAPQVTERVIERVVQAPTPSPVNPAPAPERAAVTKAAEPVAAQPQPMPVKSNAEVTTPAFNRTYLQLGSVEVGVAEVMVEGLRQRGVPAIVGIGINGKVARVLVGPFSSPDEQRVAQKHVEELGFHPFPRVFTEKDLEQQPEPAPAGAAVATPAKPPVVVTPPQQQQQQKTPPAKL